MSKDSFVCPLCRARKKKEMYHCTDHCMDMCGDHVRESKTGRFYCLECEKPVKRLIHDGMAWQLA